MAELTKLEPLRREGFDRYKDAAESQQEKKPVDGPFAPLVDGTTVVPALTARDISLYDVLKLVCEVTGTKLRITDGTFKIEPLDDPGMESREDEKSGETEAANQAVVNKLRSIILPEVDIRPPATLADAVAFFLQASRDYDDPEIPLSQRGVSIVLKQDGAEPKADAPPPPPKPLPPPVPHVNPFVQTAAQPLSTFAIGTDTASYALTRQSLANGTLPDPAVVRVEEFVNALDYKDSAPERATFRIIAEGAPSPFGRDTRLVRLAIKGRRLGREEQRPANLVFLVDASGSMAQPDRMGAVQLALEQLLQGLRPEDRLQIVTFNETARLVQPQASAADADAIMANFRRVQATGPTSLERGMVMAYQQAVATFQPGAENRVILITDGIANLGSGEAGEILARIDDCRRQGIRLSVFGVGRGTYNDALLQQLANKGDGTYRFLDSPDAITAAFVNDLSATLYTIASDAKVQVEWFPAAVPEYRQLGYEARALTAEQFRDDTVVAGQIGSGQTASALYEISLADTRDLPPNAELGIVRIRFRPSAGGPVEEISRPILRSDLAGSFTAARPEFQLAAIAAGFAERLRRSPYAPPQGYADLADLARPAAGQLHLDTRFAELVNLLDSAAAITR
ncbi:MAG: von Willebrand factor type A domain-containing protein [Kiritimatiellaeota bacterium]|nr:von Willebrand factor type A domain-containing protein [Kiritimatiellota bacterium]